MNQIGVLNVLIDRGWISLRQLGILLNTPTRSIYGRQRTKKPVETIRIGGIERVYTDTIKQELKEAKTLAPGEAGALLALLNTGTHAHERKEKEHG